MPNFDAYGGATITRVIDGAQAEWIGMCGKMDGRFGFYVWRNSVNIPLTPFCTGRGSIEENGHWIAWDGSVYHTGALPGFVPARRADDPVPIPAGGALTQLYTGVYVAADFDTPAETALRVQKQLDAIQELTELLKRAGVLA
jgi:hypothetical protein